MNQYIHMRYLLMISLFLFMPGCTPKKEYPALVEAVTSLYDSSRAPFYHGVASGDPLSNHVIIWTRVTPADSLPAIQVTWEISTDTTFATILQSDTLSTTPARDYTVKVDVPGLAPDTYYYYRFKALHTSSPIGRTKTTPVGSRDSVSFAVVSCSNWEWGYFNAYALIADKPVDAVLHLGDYIYEYGTGRYGDTTIGRFNLPPYEIVSLQDYRTRHSLYRLDAGLQKMSAAHPFIAIWDDHEVANNTFKSGAQNHQPDKEGDFFARRDAARKAYYEWIPIRENDKHYRSFSFGQLAKLIMLDERLEGRDEPPATPDDAQQQRSMLGEEQLNWLFENLKTDAHWKVIGNQVIFSDIDLRAVYPKMPRNLDAWDGYLAEKNTIKQFILQNKLKDIVFITGDTHAAWGIEVATDVGKTYNPKTSAGAFAIEFGTTSVSSANDNEYRSTDTVRLMEQTLLANNPHIKYLNDRDHGYLILTLTPDNARAEYFSVETLRQPDNRERLEKTLVAKRGTVRLN
ncbi:alkaline phosphatase D family protein [Oscillatoria amoena NRMC-F 0135]|nr:alkaline phosphatase D family protein [Oscillatoria amoena NRMC-F 0135]